MVLPLADDSFALKFKKQMQGIQKGKIKDIYGWTTKVSERIVIS